MKTKVQKDSVDREELNFRLGQVVEAKGNLEEKVKIRERELSKASALTTDLEEKLQQVNVFFVCLLQIFIYGGQRRYDLLIPDS